MTSHVQQFQVAQLRAKNMTKAVESVSVFMLAIFISAFLPSLLIRYVYANQQLLEQPALLEYIPVISLVIGVGYFLFAMGGNMMRERTAQQLEKEVIALGDMCDCENCGHSHDTWSDEVINEEAVAKRDTKAKKAVKSRKK